MSGSEVEMNGTDTGWMLAAGLAALAAVGLLMPRAAAKAYGVRNTDTEGRALARAVVMRDLGIAATLGAALGTEPKLAIVPAAAAAAVSAGDLVNVVATGRPRTFPVLVHLTGFALGAMTATRLARA
jgi:hypothetical protein